MTLCPFFFQVNPTIKSSNVNDEVQTPNTLITAEAKKNTKVTTDAITEAGENVQSSILQPILDLIPIKAMDNDDEDDDNFHEDDDDDDDDEHENADVAEKGDVGDILQEIDAEEAKLANRSSPTRQDLNIGN